MAHNLSLAMRYITRDKPVEPREHPTPGRDRSLSGKARVRARRKGKR